MCIFFYFLARVATHIAVLPWQVVRLSVTLKYYGHIVWVSSKIITHRLYILRLGPRSRQPKHYHSSPRGTSPTFRWKKSGVWKVVVYSTNDVISLEWSKIQRKLLLTAYIVIHEVSISAKM